MPVVQELERRGWVNKRWQTRQGRERGSRPFDRTSLHRLVINSIGGLDSVVSQLGVLLGNGDGTFWAPSSTAPRAGRTATWFWATLTNGGPWPGICRERG